jgi:hypothetical protein
MVAVLVVLAAGLLAGWSMLRLDEAREAVAREAETLRDVEGLALKIAEYRQAPQAVSDRELESTLLARLIEHSADRAGVPRRALDRIWPQPPRRVGDTPYQRAATQLLLRDVTLPQAAAFLSGLATATTPLSVDSLRLSAPRSERETSGGSGGRKTSRGSGGGGGDETWTLEATVSHLHYQPTAGSDSVARKD